MATIDYVVEFHGDKTRASVILWANMKSGDVGRSLDISNQSDRTIQVTGTFSGASATLKGSNNPGPSPLYDTLRDPFNSLLVFTGEDLKQILEVPHRVRPEISGGDLNTNLTVRICAVLVEE